MWRKTPSIWCVVDTWRGSIRFRYCVTETKCAEFIQPLSHILIYVSTQDHVWAWNEIGYPGLTRLEPARSEKGAFSFFFLVHKTLSRCTIFSEIDIYLVKNFNPEIISYCLGAKHWYVIKNGANIRWFTRVMAISSIRFLEC